VRARPLSVAQRYMWAKLADGPVTVPDPADKWPAYRRRTAESLVARGLAHWRSAGVLARSDVRT
jgi:hypothetical protein